MPRVKTSAGPRFRDVGAERQRRWPFWLARATTATLAALAVAQALFAGSFLGGQYDALMLHSAGAKASTLLSAAQLIVLIFVTRAGGPPRLIAIALGVTLLLVAEFASGESRLTSVHVPLGVLLIAGILQLTASVWRLPLLLRARAKQQEGSA